MARLPKRMLTAVADAKKRPATRAAPCAGNAPGTSFSRIERMDGHDFFPVGERAPGAVNDPGVGVGFPKPRSGGDARRQLHFAAPASPDLDVLDGVGTHVRAKITSLPIVGKGDATEWLPEWGR